MAETERTVLRWVQRNPNCWELQTVMGHVLADVTNGLNSIVHYRLFSGTQIRRAGLIAYVNPSARCDGPPTFFVVGKREVERIEAETVAMLRRAAEESSKNHG